MSDLPSDPYSYIQLTCYKNNLGETICDKVYLNYVYRRNLTTKQAKLIPRKHIGG